MTPAYIRSCEGSQGNGRKQPVQGQNIPKNANDHEQMARVHPAQPSYFVVVPTTELGESINVAVGREMGTIAGFTRGLDLPDTRTGQRQPV
jgi:hypothetical protein